MSLHILRFLVEDFFFKNWIDYNGNIVADHQLGIDKNKFSFKIEADALRAAPESCFIYINRDRPFVKHSFRIELSLLPGKTDEHTRAHTRLGFVVEQSGQRFFTKPYVWSPPISITLDSCQTTSSWRSRPGLVVHSFTSIKMTRFCQIRPHVYR